MQVAQVVQVRLVMDSSLCLNNEGFENAMGVREWQEGSTIYQSKTIIPQEANAPHCFRNIIKDNHDV